MAPGRGSFACTECGRIFAKHYSLQKHTVAQHGQFTCSACQFVVDKWDNMEQHIATAHAQFLYGCPMCFKKFSSLMKLNLHAGYSDYGDPEQKTTRPHYCRNEQCGRWFCSSRACRSHEATCSYARGRHNKGTSTDDAAANTSATASTVSASASHRKLFNAALEADNIVDFIPGGSCPLSAAFETSQPASKTGCEQDGVREKEKDDRKCRGRKRKGKKDNRGSNPKTGNTHAGTDDQADTPSAAAISSFSQW